MSIVRFSAGRVLQAVPTLVLVTLAIFALMHLAPGDPVTTMLGTDFSPETEQALRSQLGLDKPLPVQYLTWLGRAVAGDFGTSIRTKEPVAKMIGDRFVATATLAGFALVATILVAIPVGVISAANRNTGVDYLWMAGAVLGLSVPS